VPICDEKLTTPAWEMTCAGGGGRKEDGVSECDIVVVNRIVGYFACMNRRADGIGVPLEGFCVEPGWRTVALRGDPVRIDDARDRATEATAR
jgi:hypothetical protein